MILSDERIKGIKERHNHLPIVEDMLDTIADLKRQLIDRGGTAMAREYSEAAWKHVFEGLNGDCACDHHKALAAHDAELEERVRRETLCEPAWLIEKGQLCFGFCDYRFAWVTFTSNDALRFSRKRDAYSFREAMKWTTKAWGDNLAHTEIHDHCWSDPAKRRSTGCVFCDSGDKPTNGRHYIFDEAVNATHSHLCSAKRSAGYV